MPEGDPNQFLTDYGPLAVDAGNQLGVAPNVILGQWGLETGWGSSRYAQDRHNLAGIGGDANNTSYSSPAAFKDAYVDLLQRKYPGALNTGSNSDAFASGLKKGGYFESDLPSYQSGLAGRAGTISGLNPDMGVAPKTNARAQMADASTDTAATDTPDPSVLNTPVLATTPDQVRQTLGLLGMSTGGGDNKNQSWVSKLGAAMGGGQGNLTGADAEQAGVRSLMNFGVGLLSQSGFHPIRTTMGEALAAGLQGAQASELGSQQLQRDTVQKALGYLQEQQGLGLRGGELRIAQQKLALEQQNALLEMNRQRALAGLPPLTSLAGGLGAPSRAVISAAPAPSTAPATPPLKIGPADVAPADVQVGGEPPPPPGGSSAPYSGGGIGAALQPPPGTPTAGPPVLPLQKGSPVPAGALLKSDAGTNGDQVASDVAAMQKGQLLSQGGTPPGTVAAAGPAAGTPPTIGNYNNVPPPARPPASTLPSPSTPVDALAAARPDLAARLTDATAGKLLPAQEAALAQNQHDALLAGDSTAQQSALAAVRNKRAEMIAANLKDVNADINAWHTAQDANKNALEMEKVKANQTSQQKQEDADMTEGAAITGDLRGKAVKASNINNIVGLLGPNMANLPQGSVADIVGKNPDLLPFLLHSGAVTPENATSVQLLNAVRDYVSTQMHAEPGSAREAEMVRLSAMLPDVATTEQGQKKMLGYILTLNDRAQQESVEANKLFKAKAPYRMPPDWQQQIDAKLGPVIPQPPALDNPNPDAAHPNYDAYVNGIKPGRAYIGYRKNSKDIDPTTGFPRMQRVEMYKPWEQ